MSYATPSDLLKRYDTRVLGDLVSDLGQRINPANLATDPNIQAVLDDASGMINAAVLVGKRYLITDLTTLTGVDQAYLIRLVCDLAFGLLYQRRGYETAKLTQYQTSLDILQQLTQGQRIFNVLAVQTTGNVTSEFPSVTTLTQLDLMRDGATPHFFPNRRQQSTTPADI